MIHAQPERAAWSRRSATRFGDVRDATPPRKSLTIRHALQFIGALVLLALTACGGTATSDGDARQSAAVSSSDTSGPEET